MYNYHHVYESRKNPISARKHLVQKVVKKLVLLHT